MSEKTIEQRVQDVLDEILVRKVVPLNSKSAYGTFISFNRSYL